MKNLKPLSKAEMKKVLGGTAGDVTCTILIVVGCFGSGGPNPKITAPSVEAAQAYCSSDPCCEAVVC
jgi:hypothetical protein